jgi:alpha-ribazole phosphatase
VAVEKSVCYGQSDVALAETFQMELINIQNKLTLNNNCVIYSSPLKRSLQLAKTISPPIQPVIDARLMELNFGEWELKKWDEINKHELDLWMNDFVNIPCMGGESHKDLYQRSSEFFNECIIKPHKQVLIIAHGGVIRSILSLILQIPLVKSFSLQIDCGKISKIKVINKENIIIEYINH